MSTYQLFHAAYKDCNAKFSAKVLVYAILKINATLLALCWKSVDHNGLS